MSETSKLPFKIERVWTVPKDEQYRHFIGGTKLVRYSHSAWEGSSSPGETGRYVRHVSTDSEFTAKMNSSPNWSHRQELLRAFGKGGV